MPIIVRTRPATLSAELEITCDDMTAAWTVLCKIEELFSHKECGLCQGPIKMAVRKGGDNLYYEWQCVAEGCGARLQAHEYNPKTSGKTGLYFKWDDEWTIYKMAADAGGGQGPPILVSA